MIDFEVFLNWVEKHFDSVKVSGNEIKLNSIYDPDQNDNKHKLWCNPTGETKNGIREYGVYHCWISGKKGTLVGLVIDVENCSYKEACEIIEADGNIDDLEEKLNEFFLGTKKETIIPSPSKKIISLPEETSWISSLSIWTRSRKNAEDYLRSRRIPIAGLAYCSQGIYRDRIVIPYYDQDGDLIYYNSRYIGPSAKAPKYLGPPKEIGVGKGDIVYMPKWANAGLLHVVEGEFDAMVLSMCGLPSCAVGGSHLTDYQRKILSNYKIKLCGDIDKPGAGAVFRIGTQMLQEGFKEISFVRPPIGYKDWNDFYIVFGEKIVDWIEQKTKNFNLISAEQLFAENI